MMGDNGERELYKHEGGEEKKKLQSDTRNSGRLRKKRQKHAEKKMVKPLSLESINHKKPAVSP